MAGGRFLIVTWDGGGNLPPVLALATRLVDAGHAVTIMADRFSGDGAAACGAELVEFPSVGAWPPGRTFEDDPVRFEEIRNGVPIANDVLDAARDIQPDVMVVDCMSGAGFVASERLDIPTAVLVHVLYQPFISWWADLAVDTSRIREALGLQPLGSPSMIEQLERAAKVLVLTPESFDFAGAPRTDETHYVGPIFHPRVPVPPDDLGFSPSDQRPLVLVSLSTTSQRQDEALPPILEALSRLPVRGLLTLGGVDARVPLTVPPNVAVRDHVPHDSIMGQVSAVVSHGGLSTVMTSLAHGVPLVCIPQGRDQPLNAERVEACGVGINLPIDADPQVIADAVSAVLDQPGFREAARSMSTLIGRSGAGGTAVSHVEALL
jgi:MGT family glycosyltransferase